MEETTTPNPWNDFWASVGDFFLAKDAYGISYLARILMAIAIIVLGWFIIRFIGFLLKKAFGIKKKDLTLMSVQSSSL